jgi:exocyst complex component 2
LYNPVLDSRAKAERLRATLIILNRHKEYFNLPSLIANDIKRVRRNWQLTQGDSDTLLASYNRAQSLYAEYTGATPLTSAPPSANSALANRRVFDKVWEEVQRLVAGYRNYLMRKLKESKGFGNANPKIDALLEGIEYCTTMAYLVYSSLWTNLFTRYRRWSVTIH